MPPSANQQDERASPASHSSQQPATKKRKGRGRDVYQEIIDFEKRTGMTICEMEEAIGRTYADGSQLGGKLPSHYWARRNLIEQEAAQAAHALKRGEEPRVRSLDFWVRYLHAFATTGQKKEEPEPSSATVGGSAQTLEAENGTASVVASPLLQKISAIVPDVTAPSKYSGSLTSVQLSAQAGLLPPQEGQPRASLADVIEHFAYLEHYLESDHQPLNQELVNNIRRVICYNSHELGWYPAPPPQPQTEESRLILKEPRRSLRLSAKASKAGPSNTAL